MKDSVRGLTEKGNSVLLLELAKKVGSMPGMVDGVTKSVAQSHVNVVEMTTLGRENDLQSMDAIEEEPTNENVFVMEETGDFFLTYETSEGIVVKDGVGNDEVVGSWDMGLYKSLRELIIGDGCFAYMAGLKLEVMDTLEKVEIGGECFSLAEGTLEVVNCHKLKCLKIGSDSCVGWSEFVLKNCGVVEVEIGDGCFVYCEKVVVKNLNQLKTLLVDWNTFLNVKDATLVNIPNLSQVSLGNAFSSVETVTMTNASLIEQESRNEVIMRNRKELYGASHFNGRVVFTCRACFPAFFASFDISHFAVLCELIIGDGCFRKVNGFELRGKEYLEKVEIGNGCFSKSKGVMIVVDCAKLKHLKIGSDSFTEWSEFVLKNCGVEEIDIGDGCFVNCEKTTIMDLVGLKELRIGKEVFRGRKNEKNELEMRSGKGREE